MVTFWLYVQGLRIRVEATAEVSSREEWRHKDKDMLPPDRCIYVLHDCFRYHRFRPAINLVPFTTTAIAHPLLDPPWLLPPAYHMPR